LPKTCKYSIFALLINVLIFIQMSFAQRLKKARTDKRLSQTELARLVGIHYTQIGRYETKGAQPSADVLSKIANALEVSSDFLTNGTADDLADSSLTDKELLNQFKVIEKMTKREKSSGEDIPRCFHYKG
jgi:transcriptional regulator with XRE-family HTH domain